MALTAVKLTIDAVEINQASAGVTLGEWVLSLDGVDSLELMELRCDRSREPSYLGGMSVDLELNFGSGYGKYFTGQIVSSRPVWSELGWQIAYRALGLPYIVNFNAVTNPNGPWANKYRFNAQRNDPDYIASLSGLTVGEMIVTVLNDHDTVLTAAGVTTTFPLAGGDLTQFTDLDWTPPEPVEIGGDRLWDALIAFLLEWAPNHRLRLTPGGALQLFNLSSLSSSVTLTEGTDFIDAPVFERSVEQCATAVLGVGGDDIEGIPLNTVDGSLVVKYDIPDETDDWNIVDHYDNPQTNAVFRGTCSCTASVVTCDPDDDTLTLTTNELSQSGAQGWLTLKSTTLAGLVTEWVTRPIVSHTSLSAASDFDATVEPDLPSTSYDTFECYALQQGLTHVYRRFEPAAQYFGKLRTRFPNMVPFVYASGSSAAIMTEYPIGFVRHNGGGQSRSIWVDPAENEIWFLEPVVTYNNTNSVLVTGGSGVVSPDEIIAFCPISKGALEARVPTSGFEGTAYDDEGIERVLTVPLPGWTDARASDRVSAFLEEVLASVKDAAISGSVRLYDIYESLLTLGKKLNVAGTSYTTGYESAGLPIRQVAVSWFQENNGPVEATMDIVVSNARRTGVGDKLYLHSITRPPTDGILFAGTALEGQMEGVALGGSSSVMGLANQAAYQTSGQATMDTIGRISDAGAQSAGAIAGALWQGAANAKPLPQDDPITGNDLYRVAKSDEQRSQAMNLMDNGATPTQAARAINFQNTSRARAEAHAIAVDRVRGEQLLRERRKEERARAVSRRAEGQWSLYAGLTRGSYMVEGQDY